MFYQWLVTIKSKSSRICYRREHIIVFRKVICGFRSFLVLLRISLHVCNDVHVVSFYSSLRCFWIFSTMIKHKKPKARMQRRWVYPLVHFISLLNKFVFVCVTDVCWWMMCVDWYWSDRRVVGICSKFVSCSILSTYSITETSSTKSLILTSNTVRNQTTIHYVS